MDNHQKKISVKTKLGYSAAAIGDACSYTFIGAFLLFFLTSVIGIHPVTAGTIVAIGSIWNSIWSPIVGYISDKSNSKYGRRRPFLILTAFPLGIVIIMLFRDVAANETVKIIYYGLSVIIFWTMFVSFYVPYLAFGAEITDDYSQRTVLRSYVYIFSTVGGMVGLAFPPFIVNYLGDAGETVISAWEKAGIIVGIMTTASIIVTWYCTRGKEASKCRTDKDNNNHINNRRHLYSIVKEYWEVLKLKPIRYMIGSSVFYLLAYTMVNSDRMYFLTYNLNMEQGTISIIFLITSLLGIIFTPLILALNKFMDKRKIFVTCMSVSCSGIIIVSIIGFKTFWSVILFSLIFSLSSSCYWQLSPAMIYDVCEVDELISGKRREGIIMSIQSLSEALASGIAVQMLGIILGLSGFNGKAVLQKKLTLDWIEGCLTIIPAAFMIAAIVMVVKYPITKKRYNIVKRALTKKSKGEEYEVDELEIFL